jgi:hypothetical protein
MRVPWLGWYSTYICIYDDIFPERMILRESPIFIMKSILHIPNHGEVSSIIAKTSFLFNVGFNLAEIFKYVYSTLKFNNVEIFFDKDDFRPRDRYRKCLSYEGRRNLSSED